jgi:hypothetical protein
MTIFGILKHEEFYYLLGLTILSEIAVVISTSPLIMIKSQVLRFKADTKIIIESGVTTSVTSYSKTLKSVSNLKKVIDVGGCYYLIFKFRDIRNSWICEKSLITKGTLQEFERLFKGEIVRKSGKTLHE